MDLHHLPRPEGRIAWTSQGSGPLVLLIPGMGDIRATWRELVGPLSTTHRVLTMDLRGHGDSDTTFTRHGDEVTAEDVLALIEHVDAGPAVLIGNSMGASAAVWAAAERPDLVSGLVLVSPFLSEPNPSRALRAVMHAAYRLLFARPWGAAAWTRYYAGPLNRGRTAAWLPEHTAGIRSWLARPGALRSLRDLMLQLDHSGVAQRAERVAAAGTPSLVVIGERDPDYRDPAAELERATATLQGEGLLVAESAHYPQHQAPETVLPRIETFLGRLRSPGSGWLAAHA
ncbi:alpha/beta fold hydrolase [Actinotalea sp.]|uniref:alpha/beta fold hydrolase n=1 Tax=Actinotalea sp. TaxID=1872145 RepID=UPI00356552EA